MNGRQFLYLGISILLGAQLLFSTPVFADIEKPSVTITSPTDGTSVSGEVQVNAVAIDDTGVTKVVYNVDGIWVGKDTSAPYSYTWNTFNYADGVHEVQASAYDTAGNIRRHRLFVAVNNDANGTNAPSVTITSPADGAIVSGEVQVNAVAIDDTGVTKVVYNVDGIWVGKDTSAPYSYTWNTFNYADGVHEVQASAYDTAGNIRRHRLFVAVNNDANGTNAPSVTITSPADGAIVSGEVQVNAVAIDDTGVTKVVYNVDGIWVGKDTSAPYSYTWNTFNYADGVHEVQASAYDTAGNIRRHRLFVAVNNDANGTNAPSVTITSPADGAIVSGEVQVNAVAIDDTGVTKVVYNVDGIWVGKDTSAPYSYTWNTFNYADGVHEVQASAYDTAGNIRRHRLYVTVNNPFIRPFLLYYGGGPSLLDADMERLAKFDLLGIDRFRYNNPGFKNLRDSGLSLSDLNSVVEIFLYQMGPEVSNYHDDFDVTGLNDIARYQVSRGHSRGSLNNNHPELFLLNNMGNRSYNFDFSDPGKNEFWYLMDIGSKDYIDYWLEATETDIISQAWVTDGILVDNCSVFNNARAQPVQYPDDSTWSTAMNQFVQAIVTGLESSGQKTWANRGQTSDRYGFDDWLALDQSGNAPSVVMEEGAFAVSWGDNSDTRFYPENNWKRQVDLMGMIENSRIAFLSHTDLDDTEVGIDSSGKAVTFWQSMYYALGSYLLGKNDLLNNAYFMFRGKSGYSKIWWYDEYEKIDFGRAMGNYQILDMNGNNIYWREFISGYVYVNPTENDVNGVVLPGLGKLVTHENLLDPLSSIPIVSSFNIPSHHAVFVHKL